MKRPILLLVTVCLLTVTGQAQTYTLTATNYDGKTTYFVDRGTVDGKTTYGIKGEGSTGEVHSADMWFNSFPGNSGIYNVQFGVVLEDDGDPEYEVKAGTRTIKKGRYPYPNGSRICSGTYKKTSYLDLGDHQVNKGEKINIWGKSVYYCGSTGSWHGAYTRWYEIKFVYKSEGTTGGTAYFNESGGVLCVEAENYHKKIDRKPVGHQYVHVWTYKTDKDPSGGAYLHNLPVERGADDIGPNSPKDNSGPELVFNIKINTPGTYYIWVLGMSEHGESNGVHVGVDNIFITNGPGTNMSGFRPYFQWVWEHASKDYAAEAKLPLAAGDHTLHVWGRDDGFRCDKILLDIGRTSAPSGTGPAESQEVNGGTTATKPSITTQPRSTTATEGQQATFSVSAVGTAPLSYQWYKNGAAISGATGTSYQTPITTLADNGNKYKCVVTNGQGSVTSNEAVLTVVQQGSTAEVVLEAENMTLNGYIKDSGMDNTAIKVDYNNGTTGTATASFSGISGIYTITLYAVPEDDGTPTIRLSVAGTKVLEKVYPTDPSYADKTYRELYTVSNVSINQGDQIKLEGVVQGGANARVDKIVFSPSNSTAVDNRQLAIDKQTFRFMPNPMRTFVQFAGKANRNGYITIFGPDGNLVNTITGNRWDGTDTAGKTVKPGIYFYKAGNNSTLASGRIIKVE